MRSVLALIVVAWFSGSVSAGPIREWVQQHRPGVIIPKRTAPSCTPAAAGRSNCVCGDSCSCAPGACPAKCPVRSPDTVQLWGSTYYQTLYQTLSAPSSGCAGGSCPAAPGRRGLFR
jgi:hypothetical protein